MTQTRYLLSICALLSSIILASGCATTTSSTARTQPRESGIEHVGPIDTDEIEQALRSAPPRPAEDILEEAQQALLAANRAHEQGDSTTAMREYTLALELLIEADLDPTILYNMRGKLERIISISSEQAMLFRHAEPRDPVDVAHVKGDFEVPDPIPRNVLREIDRIQNAYPTAFQRGLDRSNRYAPYIRRELAKAGIPEDMVWLAMVESQFTPKIVSRAGAGGMWQFMQSTGKRYDLRIDSHVDERYDWKRSTQAAIEYLTELHRVFGGRWPLAVTAYNMGEYGLSRAINSNGGEQNLWQLIETPPASYHIRRETKEFYAKLLATIIVAKDPERYGFASNPEPPEMTVHTPITGCYALEDLDKACGLEPGTLAKLNPQFLRGITPPLGQYNINVPVDNHSQFLAALNDVDQTQPEMALVSSRTFSRTFTHRVQRGETLSHIAARYGVSVNDIMRANNIRSANRLRSGQKLRIHGARSSASGTVTTASNGSKIYHVRPGDTLIEIANAHGTTVRAIQDLNNLGSSTRINVNDRLIVSASTGGSTTKIAYTDETVTHVVESGEFPGMIAKKYSVGVDDLLRWNGLNPRSTIHVGDRMIVYLPQRTVASASSDDGARIIHVVKRGDSASSIAAQYGVRTSDFLHWNGLNSRSVLHVGDKYVIQSSGQTSQTSSSDQKKVHVVARGQNPTTIARLYGVGVDDVLRWNNLDKTSVLRIGDKLVVFSE